MASLATQHSGEDRPEPGRRRRLSTILQLPCTVTGIIATIVTVLSVVVIAVSWTQPSTPMKTTLWGLAFLGQLVGGLFAFVAVFRDRERSALTLLALVPPMLVLLAFLLTDAAGSAG